MAKSVTVVDNSKTTRMTEKRRRQLKSSIHALLAKGLSYGEVARELDISKSEVHVLAHEKDEKEAPHED